MGIPWTKQHLDRLCDAGLFPKPILWSMRKRRWTPRQIKTFLAGLGVGADGDAASLLAALVIGAHFDAHWPETCGRLRLNWGKNWRDLPHNTLTFLTIFFLLASSSCNSLPIENTTFFSRIANCSRTCSPVISDSYDNFARVN